MKNRILTLLVCGLALLSVSSASAWSNGGHCTVGHIADQHLTPKTRKLCEKYLGHTLAYHASWMDHIRYTKELHPTARWHAVGVIDDKLVPPDDGGDVVGFSYPKTPEEHLIFQLERMRKEMGKGGYKKMTDSLVSQNIKLLVHMLGDLHCPSHTFFVELKQFPFTVKGEPSRYHGFWDKAFRRFHKGMKSDDFYREYCSHLSAKEIKAICKGEPEEWLRNNFAMLRETYTLLDPNTDYKDLPEKNKERMKEISTQMHRDAGFRLAHILNEIFK